MVKTNMSIRAAGFTGVTHPLSQLSLGGVVSGAAYLAQRGKNNSQRALSGTVLTTTKEVKVSCVLSFRTFVTHCDHMLT